MQAFTARDDRFHFAEMGDAWWATETAWFSFHHRERRLGGWLYTMVRPNIGSFAGGAWLWDDVAHLPWEALYSANYTALQLPRDQDLDDCALPNGVSIRVIEPCMSYSLSYDDGDRLQARLQFSGVMPPQPLTAVARPDVGRASGGSTAAGRLCHRGHAARRRIPRGDERARRTRRGLVR